MNWDNYFKDYNVKTAHSYLTDMEQSLAVATSDGYRNTYY
jgi:hypothetical protein